jgi:hypothetical protein
MGLVQQPWRCGDREGWSVAEWRRVGASKNCKLAMCELSFVENAGLSRKLGNAISRVAKRQTSDFCSASISCLSL